jgi:SAM-dependent methyltransferase
MADDRLQQTYDLVAGDYVAHIFDELKDKSFDRALLDEMAVRAGGGVICDLGCGPGQVARYLHERGATVRGVDLSPGMIDRARALTPGVPFEAGDMRALDVPDGAWQAIVAFYSIVHFRREELAGVFREMKRVLAPGGALLLSFHIGSEVVHRDEWWGHAVDVDFLFFQTAEVEAALEESGLNIERVLERDPYPEIEYQSRRAYIVAVKPRSSS